MTARRYVPAAIPLYVLVLAALFVPSQFVSPVSATHTPANPFPWRTYGPESQFLRFQFYAGPEREFEALVAGDIDLYDFYLTKAQQLQIQGDQILSANIDVTVNVFAGGVRPIDINHHNLFFTVPDDNGNSPITVELFQALSHLIDKEGWIIEGPLGGEAYRMDTPGEAPHTQVDIDNDPANGIQSYSPDWDTLHPGTISAYNLAAEPVGTFGIPPVGSLDFCAAADHVVEFGRLATAAGHFGGVNPFSKTPATCVVTGWVAAMGQLTYAIRNDPGDSRLDLGQRHAGVIEALFGGANVVNELFGSIDKLRPVVFRHCDICTPGAHTYTAASVRDWHFSTGGWSSGALGGDALWFLYGNLFSGRANEALNAQGLANLNCGTGNPQFRFPLNYGGFCRADYDPVAFEAFSSVTIQQHVSAVNRANAIAGQRLPTIPIHVFSAPQAALKDAVYTVTLGFDGVSAPATWMLARPRDPADNGQYDFGGPGTANDNVIRQGNRGGTETLNVFQAAGFFSEFQVFSAIYGSMLFQNPDAPAQQFFDWQSKRHEVFVSPTATELGYTPPVGTAMTTRWELRPGILFHDGSTLNALDVAFTALSYRDAPATGLGSLFEELIDVTVVDCGRPACPLDPVGGPGEPLIIDMHWETASFFHELNSGDAPLLPRELWERVGPQPPENTYTLSKEFPGANIVINKFSTAKTALGYDPMVAGTLVGSGNWVCRDLANPSRIGGGCARTAAGTPDDGSLSAGSTVLMERNEDYFRAKGAVYEGFNWADSIRDNAFWGTPSLPAHRHPDILGDGWMNLNDLTQFTFCIGGDVAACGASALVASGFTVAEVIDYFKLDDVPGLTQFAGVEMALFASYWEQGIYTGTANFPGPPVINPPEAALGADPVFDPFDTDYHQ